MNLFKYEFVLYLLAPYIGVCVKFISTIRLNSCPYLQVWSDAVHCRLYELIWKSCVILTWKELLMDTRHFVTAAQIWMAIGKLHCSKYTFLCFIFYFWHTGVVLPWNIQNIVVYCTAFATFAIHCTFSANAFAFAWIPLHTKPHKPQFS